MIINNRISATQVFPYSESDIRVDFNDPDKIIAAANANVVAGGTGQGQFYSRDGGATWGQGNLSLNAGDAFQSDPCVDWTSDGTAWSVTIGFDAAQTHLRLRSFKSSDGGQTWAYDADASGNQTNTDKPMMWVDHSATSPYKDNIYVIWHNGLPVFVNRRTGPAGSWQTPIQVSGAETTGTGIGGDIKTNSYGDVFAFWPDTGSSKLFMAKSTNGGAAFAAPVTIASTFDSFDIGIPAFDARRALIYISGGAYRTATKNLVFALWVDQTGVAGCNSPANEPGSNVNSNCKTRVWFARSTDGGATWAAPQMINNQASKNDQFNPKLAVDETNGQLVVMYYDTVGDPGRLKTDVWMQTSDDDGVTWSAAFRVTTAQTDETVAGADLPGGSFFGDQYGDYNGLSGYASTFFPCWTDRRGGAREEIWTAPVRTVKDALLVIDRSTFGQDEVLALLAQQSPGVIPDAFWVVVEGFTAQELGLNAGNLGSPPVVPTVMLSPGMSAMSVAFVGPVVPEDPSLPPSPQRFRYGFQVSFISDADFGFAGDFELVTLAASFTAAGVTVTSSGLLELIKKANPYMLDGPTSWLSIDLRVFKLRAGDTRFGVMMGTGPGGAPAFIQSVMQALSTGHGGAGGESFDGLSADEDASALELSPVDSGGQAVFDFALARVRMRGLTQDAPGTRVFFRLFQAQTTNAIFDRPATTAAGADPATLAYRRFWDGSQGGQAIPLLGIKGGEYVTIPCFASPRVDTTSASMTAQLDSPNVQTIAHDPGGSEVLAFYGCWLDINQPGQPVVPQSPPVMNPDGPFSSTLLSIQQAIVRSPHQCLIAEIAFDPDAIPLGVGPSTTDKLAQRNLAWVSIPNPGADGSRRVPQTFEVRPGPKVTGRAGERPDELMIDWGELPAGSTAQIYMPAVSSDEVLGLAKKLYTTRLLQRVDEHTLQCRAEAVTYVPVPPGQGIDHAGLLTIDLPASVRRGEIFSVLVRQVTDAQGRTRKPPPPPPVPGRAAQAAGGHGGTLIYWRRVAGAFQVNIPVHTKGVLLPREERQLSILRWIAQAIAHTSRWHPVFTRYLDQLAGRVTGLGGDPGIILPSPTGDWQPAPHRPRPPEAITGETGKVIGLVYDRFGDFEGFLLETEHGHEHRYHAREHEIEDLVERAWTERTVITVHTHPHQPHRPATIVVRRAPKPYQH
jgi:hypothetical protein